MSALAHALVTVPHADGASLVRAEEPRLRPHGLHHRIAKVGGHWLWRGYISAHGVPKYGPVPAARVVWEQRRTEPLAGLVLMSTCGRLDCVRPEHREPVTNEECVKRAGHLGGIADCDHDGEWNGCAKLSADQVKFIFANCRERGAGVLLARLFGVSAGTIREIKHRRSWRRTTRHLSGTVERISLRALRELVEAREAEARQDHGAVLAHAAEARTAS